MKKKLIILNSCYLTGHNCNIYGINYFNKFKFPVYDLSILTNALSKKNPKSYKFKNIYSLKKLNSIFKNNKDFYYLDMLMLSPKSIIIRLMMHWHKLQTISIERLGGYPRVKYLDIITVNSILKLFNLGRLINFIYNKIFSLLIKEDIILFAGTDSKIHNKKKTIIYAASSVYSHYLFNNNKKIEYKKKYAVYIDVNFFTHPDNFKRKNRVINFEVYKQINSFFKTFCSLTGYDLIILAHPTRNIHKMQKFFPNYKIIQNKTAELISGSEVLLNINSTSYALAVLYKKPIIYFTSNLIKPHAQNRQVISKICKELGMKFINIDDPMYSKFFLNKKNFSVNKKKYQMYINKYLKHPKSKNIHWFETLLEKIN
jgi:hypothetical protein